MKVHPWKFTNVRIRSRGYLPHWEVDDAVYFVTWRLKDSLPAEVLVRLKEEQRTIRAAVAGEADLTLGDKLEISSRFGKRLDSYLDKGSGQCHLRNDCIAQKVAEALKHFDGDRYRLYAWAVMPNHVHVIFHLRNGSQLSDIVRSWKSFTGRVACQLLKLSPPFWQEEYYDRIIRDEDDLRDSIEYVVRNPETAGLKNWPWVWPKE